MFNQKEENKAPIMVHPVEFATRLNGFIDSLDGETKEYPRRLVTSVVLATCIAYKSKLPSEPVKSVDQYITLNIQPIIDSVVDEVSKYGLFDPVVISRSVRQIYRMRYNLVYEPLNPETAAMLLRIHCDTMNEYEFKSSVISNSTLTISGEVIRRYNIVSTEFMSCLKF